MTSYTLFSQAAPSGSVQSDTAAYTMGVQVSVSTAATAAAIWWYSPSGATELPESIAVFAVSGATLVHSESATWSGAAGSGWVRAAFASPPSLSASTAYKAAILKTGSSNGWYAEADNYWSSGPGAAGITNGPLSAPASAGASPGQDSFNTGAALTYPGSTFGSANYWVDVEVTPSASQSGTGNAALSLSVASSGTSARAGTGTAAVALHASSAGVPRKAGTGTAALSLLASATGAARRIGAAVAALVLSASATTAAASVRRAAVPWWINTATVETYTGAGAYGPVYAAPVTIPCFIDDSAKWLRHPAGDEVVSGTTIYAPLDSAAVLTAQSRVTVNGRVARVITVNSLDGDAFGLPSHVAAILT